MGPLILAGRVVDLPHSFRDPSLLELALTHASTDAGKSNERLEFLGDAALDLIVAEELFRTHPGEPEGALTELKASVVSRKSLAEAGAALHLDEIARVGGGMRGRTLPNSVKANLYEAVLGAVYLDGGYGSARDFALATLGLSLERVRRLAGTPNPKQRLQHHCQQHWSSLPVYEQLEQRGRAHARAFLVAAVVEGERYPSAWGRTLKEAESWAAHEALLLLENDRAE
jgi:ribonuclease-3